MRRNLAVDKNGVASGKAGIHRQNGSTPGLQRAGKTIAFDGILHDQRDAAPLERDLTAGFFRAIQRQGEGKDRSAGTRVFQFE